MTTPAPPAAPPASAAVTAAETALAIQIASSLVQALTPEQALSQVLPAIRHLAITPAAMLPVLQLVMSMPQEVTGAAGPASLSAIRENHLRRAQFAIAAGRRITADLRLARSRGETARAAIAEALPRERRYFGQHAEAGWLRARAAAQVDSAAGMYGPVLGWRTVRDRRTSAECLAAGGKNFRADMRPAIGWPGAVHNHCRCYPGAPFRGARMIPSAYSTARMVPA